MSRRRTTRPQTICIRLTESEHANMERLMAEAGYRNRSLFIRDRMFSVRPGSRKNSLSDVRAGGGDIGSAGSGSGSLAGTGSGSRGAGSSAALASLIWHVRRIGQNVNRACASVSSVCLRMESSGDVRGARALEYWLRKISGYLHRIDSLLEDASPSGKDG